MIQQVTLTRKKAAQRTATLEEPIELILPAGKYARFAETIKVLFDKSSAKLVKRMAKGAKKK